MKRVIMEVFPTPWSPRKTVCECGGAQRHERVCERDKEQQHLAINLMLLHSRRATYRINEYIPSLYLAREGICGKEAGETGDLMGEVGPVAVAIVYDDDDDGATVVVVVMMLVRGQSPMINSLGA